MSALLLLIVFLPLAAAAAAFVAPDRAGSIARGAALAVAVGWVAVAASAPVEAGELVADPLLAASGAGLALLVAAAAAPTATAAVTGLLVLAVLPAAVGLDPAGLPDRRMAAGVALVAVLAAVRLTTLRFPLTARGLVALAGLALAAGLAGDDPAGAVGLAVVGTSVAVVAATMWGTPGRLLVPVGLLAIARVAPARTVPDGTDWVLASTAGLVLLGALALVAARVRPVEDRLPLAAALAAAALLATDVADLRSAGALLGAGAVLAIVGEHPLALLALAPGLAAAVGTAGLADRAEHAAVGAAAVAALAAATLLGPFASSARRRPGTLAGLAAAFAVVPAWDWSGAPVADHREAVVVAVAVAAPVALLTLPLWGDHVRAWRAGRIAVRPSGPPPHGTVRIDAESVPEEGPGEVARPPAP